MGKIIHKDQPCIDTTKCGSSDAMQIYEDGSSYCFSCLTRFGEKVVDEFEVVDHTDTDKASNVFSLVEIGTYTSRGFKERGVTKAIAEFFDVKVSFDSDGAIDTHYYPYGVDEITGYKIRNLPKKFIFAGKLKGLFGQRKFKNSSSKMLVITEGEIDALVVAQSWQDKNNTIYPVCSISGASNTKEILAQREWVRSFDKVVIWFDNDEPGKAAADIASKIVGYDKAYIVKSNHKDADMAYKAGGANLVIKTVYDAKKYSPAGIVSSADTWDAYKAEKAAEYIPWAPFMEELNAQIYGRRLGSITMITSGTGMGKSSWIKEDQYHLIKTRPANERIGGCSLEESIPEITINLMALEANRRIQLPDVAMTDIEERQYWEATMGGDRLLLLDHQGSVEDTSLMDKMEFMALSGCKYIYLDHVTIAVSETEDGDINRAIDVLMSNLLKLAKRHNVWIGVVSHLRKVGSNQKSFEEGAIPSEDDLKGSGSLKQVPAQTLAISRNKMEKDPTKRHTSFFWILKDRFTGRSGAAGAYIFGEETGRLTHTRANEEAFEEQIKGL